jgi:hypothetical protein
MGRFTIRHTYLIDLVFTLTTTFILLLPYAKLPAICACVQWQWTHASFDNNYTNNKEATYHTAPRTK